MAQGPVRPTPYCFGSNCCAEVPQDQFVAVERFGRFTGLLEPGIHCLGPDLCSAIVSLRSISNRIMQQEVNTTAKMHSRREGLFVRVRVAIQFKVDPDNADKAFYHLTDIEGQIETFVTDAVQSTVQAENIGGSMKEALERNVHAKLAQVLPQAGFKVEKTLLTGWFFADHGVADAEKEIARARHQVSSTKESAEAAKIRVVKAAEADADAKCLQGQGMARQRAAIVDGLRDSFERDGSQLGAEKVTELLLISQYYGTLKDISTGPNSRTIFLPGQSSAPSQQKM